MQNYYSTPSGCIDGGDLRTMRLTTNHGIGSRRTPDSIIILIGRKLLAGEGICKIAIDLGLNRKTVQRHRKALGFKVILQGSSGHRGGHWRIVPPIRP